MGIFHIQKGNHLEIRHITVMVRKVLQPGHVNVPCMHLHKMGRPCIRHEPANRTTQVYGKDGGK